MANIKVKITNVVENLAGIKKLSQSYDELARAFSAAQNKSESWSVSLNRTAGTCSSLGMSMRNLSDSLNALSTGYNDFDKSMRAANTMAGKDAVGFKALKGQVDDLAGSIPMARNALADGLYQVISNGVPEGNWMSFLEDSAKSSVGGIADLGRVVTVTSTIIKNYGLSWDDAISIQDKIQTTAKNGVTSFEQLSQALPRVTGNAATLGVSIDELMGAFATLTGVSGNTAEVSTQLAAIFTALVKPSSEATKMAGEMGIQFDAAAIKAAGGFEVFLQSLDNSVKSYAAATGTLEQEVYGKLFGSAESLRALIPLQGELAGKFSDNVAAMAGSAGTIDEAFDTMAGSAENRMQAVINSLSGVTDVIGKAASWLAPYAAFTSQLGQTTAGLIALYNAVVKTSASFGKFQIITKVSEGFRSMRGAMQQTTVATGGLKTAMRSLLIGSGIGIAIIALSQAYEILSNKSSEAADTVRRSNEYIERANDSFLQTEQQVNVAIQTEIRELKTLIATKGDATKAVNALNEKYKDSFGVYETAAEWYKVLAKNSAAYAKVQAFAGKGVELEAEREKLKADAEALREQQKELQRTGDVEIKRYGKNGRREKIKGGDADKYIRLGKDAKALEDQLKKVDAAIKETDASIEHWNSKIEKLDTGAGEPESPESDGDAGKDKKDVYIEQAESINELNNNLAILKKRRDGLKNADAEEAVALSKKIRGLETYIELVKLMRGYTERSMTARNIGEAVKSYAPAEGRGLSDMLARKSADKESTLSMPEIKTPKDLSEKIGVDLEPTKGAYELAAKGMDAYTASIEANNAALEKNKEQNQLIGGAVANIGSIMGSVGNMVGDAAGEWMDYGANVISAVSQALPQILALTNAHAGEAVAGATASAASLPPPFNIIQIGASVAAVLAALASVPKFAAGGIAYGPTLGLFGEYAGASNNPEVVAPLDTLRGMLNPAPAVGGEVTVRIKGRDLAGVLNLNNLYRNRI